MGFHNCSACKDSACSAGNRGDVGLIPGLGRSSREGNVSHSSILAWEIPWTEVPGGLQSMGSPESRHNLATEHTANNSESVNSNSIQSDSRVFTYHYHLSTKFYQEVTANQGPQLQKSNYFNYPSDM